MKKPLLLHHPAMDAVVKNLKDRLDEAFEDRPRNKYPVKFGQISWNKFNDGWPDLFLETPVKNEDVIFLASFDRPETIFEQLAVIQAIPRYQARSLRLVVSYFPGTMDRVDEEGQIATAKTLARLLSMTPLTKSGPAIITIFDIHALQERLYFGDQVIPDIRTTMPLLHQWIGRQTFNKDRLTVEKERVAIVFPDDGAAKRFKKSFPDYQLVICNKIRGQGDKRTVVIKEGDPAGKYCIIVDDLLMSGGTIIGCRDALILNGAEKVSIFVPHAVCPQESWRKLEPGFFDRVVITDSCPETAMAVKGIEHFEVLTLADLLLGIIGEYKD